VVVVVAVAAAAVVAAAVAAAAAVEVAGKHRARVILIPNTLRKCTSTR